MKKIKINQSTIIQLFEDGRVEVFSKVGVYFQKTSDLDVSTIEKMYVAIQDNKEEEVEA